MFMHLYFYTSDRCEHNFLIDLDELILYKRILTKTTKCFIVSLHMINFIKYHGDKIQ